jgi:type IV pilus assembly protein PilC
LLISVLIIGFIFLLSFISRVFIVKFWLHKNIIKVPFLGSLLKSYYIASFTRTLGLLLKSDLKIVAAVGIVESTITNLAYKSQFKTLKEDINNGLNLSSSLQKDIRLFPALLWQMIEVGEATGTLSGSLIYLSQIYEDDLNNLTKNLSTSIEPLLMIVMGLLVGFIAVSIITPIYGITQNLHQ